MFAVTTLTTLDLINLVGSISAIILSILAIALSIAFFIASKNAEKETALSIGKIDNTTGTLNTLSLKMINRLTTAIITPKATDEKISDIIREVKNTGLLEQPDETGTLNKEQIEQLRVDNLIAAFYYAGLTNLALQYHLPATIGGTNEDGYIANLIDQSKTDYNILKTWINATADANQKLNDSPVKHMYDLAITWDEAVKSTREYYAAKENVQAE